MSAPDPGGALSKPKPRNISAEEDEMIKDLNAIIDRMKRSIPATPYILATPSLDPYTHYSRHEAYSFMMDYLFEPHEEHLQYRTFLYREPYQDCFTLSPGEEDIQEVERPKSQASNASQQVPKKKISLSAYKSKQVNGVITLGSKKQSPNLLPSKPPSVQTNGVHETAKKPPHVPKKAETQPNKRTAAEALLPDKPKKRPRDDRPSAAATRKDNSPYSKPINDHSRPSNATPHGLPPLMSPVPQSLGNPYDLPPIISPTLPPNIQAELDRLEIQRKRAESNASSSSDKKSQLLPVPDARYQKPDESVKANSRMRSVSVNGKSPNRDPSNWTHVPGSSLVVKLRFGKSKASTVAQLLRLPSRPNSTDKKERQEAPKERSVKQEVKGTDDILAKKEDFPKITSRRPEISKPITKTNSIATKNLDKRPRNEDDTSSSIPAKRQKPQSSHDRPSTPSQQIVSSPAMSAKSSAQKSQDLYSTPRKDLKAISMIRTNSAEGYDFTPGRSGATPASSKHLDPKAPTSAPLTKGKQVEAHALSQKSQKLNLEGRNYKHEAQRVVNGEGRQDKKRAAVIMIECILSYMAAYHLQDESSKLRGRPCEVAATWNTLLPLCRTNISYTKRFPALEGIRLYLGSAICTAICTHIAHQVNVSAKAHDSPHDPAQREPPSAYTKMLANSFLESRRWQQQARAVLPIEDLQNIYPKTWAARETTGKNLPKEGEKIPIDTNPSGPYYLPIGDDTTPIEAVRFGLKILTEFCEKERLDYTLRVTWDNE
ncbi:hypothetical protein CC78DRAFT_345660 [Lojkania enalia]|uniref:Uncharacterized protein n=1 Tax=Lojkania enalia TaxID=147567 RepID=A0A9P4K3Z5_9PLEO|nr:hypothetical protein CC78DRAFT_345660 [Didymosphaeria enalia]